MKNLKKWGYFALFALLGAVAAKAIVPDLAGQMEAKAADASARPAAPGTVNFVGAAAAAIPSVVRINNRNLVQSAGGNSLLDLFFLRQRPQQYAQSNTGSGVIISSKGYVLTNNHLVKNSQQITVELRDGSIMPAEIIGTDAATDLAVLKIIPPDDTALPVMDVRSSEELAVGESVLAIGNPFGIGQTVTRGIVSALGRETSNPYLQMIQIDAAINPGNSGGALIDSAGNLLGIPTLLISKTGQWSGIGYAIPIEAALRVAEDIISYGDVPRGWLGMLAVRDLSGRLAGQLGLQAAVLMQNLELDGALARAGVQAGDLLTQINGKPASSKLLRQYLNAIRPNERLALQLWREHQLIDVNVTSTERPANQLQF